MVGEREMACVSCMLQSIRETTQGALGSGTGLVALEMQNYLEGRSVYKVC